MLLHAGLTITCILIRAFASKTRSQTRSFSGTPLCKYMTAMLHTSKDCYMLLSCRINSLHHSRSPKSIYKKSRKRTNTTAQFYVVPRWISRAILMSSPSHYFYLLIHIVKCAKSWVCIPMEAQYKSNNRVQSAI